MDRDLPQPSYRIGPGAQSNKNPTGSKGARLDPVGIFWVEEGSSQNLPASI